VAFLKQGFIHEATGATISNDDIAANQFTTYDEQAEHEFKRT